MKSLFIILTISLTTLTCVFAEGDTAFAQKLADRNAKLKRKIELSTEQLQALVVAAKAFESYPQLNEEQRKLSNYNVWILEGDGPDEIVVAFLAIARKGDEYVIGGNYDYARSMNFVINSKTFEVKKVIGSR